MDILLDADLPDLDGYEGHRRLRAVHWSKRRTVIIQTGRKRSDESDLPQKKPARMTSSSSRSIARQAVGSDRATIGSATGRRPIRRPQRAIESRDPGTIHYAIAFSCVIGLVMDRCLPMVAAFIRRATMRALGSASRCG